MLLLSLLFNELWLCQFNKSRKLLYFFLLYHQRRLTFTVHVKYLSCKNVNLGDKNTFLYTFFIYFILVFLLWIFNRNVNICMEKLLCFSLWWHKRLISSLLFLTHSWLFLLFVKSCFCSLWTKFLLLKNWCWISLSLLSFDIYWSYD